MSARCANVRRAYYAKTLHWRRQDAANGAYVYDVYVECDNGTFHCRTFYNEAQARDMVNHIMSGADLPADLIRARSPHWTRIAYTIRRHPVGTVTNAWASPDTPIQVHYQVNHGAKIYAAGAFDTEEDAAQAACDMVGKDEPLPRVPVEREEGA